MHDIQLSPHFKLNEFLKSSTASARGIDNTPSIEVVSNLQQLCIHVLEPLRAYINSPSSSAVTSSPRSGGMRGVVISSGYRSPALNKAVGGSTKSQHMTGEAADLRIPSEAEGKEWFKWLMDNCPFHQLIWEKDTPQSTHHWIHVSFKQSGKNAQQVIENLVKNK